MIQNKGLRIIGFHHLADIVNRHTPISKQKMFLRGAGRRNRAQGQGYRVQGKTKQQKRPGETFLDPFCFLCPVPWTLNPGPYFSRMAIASISMSASGLTSALTTTPVAAGNPFRKYFRRTAAVPLYPSRVVT